MFYCAYIVHPLCDSCMNIFAKKGERFVTQL